MGYDMTALLAAFAISSKRARMVGIDSDELPLMYLLVAVETLGARLFYFLFSIPRTIPNPLIFLSPNEAGWSSMVARSEGF